MSIKSRFVHAAAGVMAAAALVQPYIISAEGNPYSGGWGNCTWSAWELAASAGYILPALGNAGSWYANAAAIGMAVGSTPAPNSIIVYSNHVGYVSAVDGSMVYIQEGGWEGGYHEGWWDGTSARFQTLIGYIYLDGYAYTGSYSYTDIISAAAANVSAVTDNTPIATIGSTVTYSEDAQATIENEQNSVVFDDAPQDQLQADESQAVEAYSEEVQSSRVIAGS